MLGVFLQSATVLLREGLEALLVLAALAAYLHKAQARERVFWLYGGALAAVAASVFTAWVFATLNQHVHNDLMEARILLMAAALMLYVSGWLFLRQDPRAWQGFLKAKAAAALARRTGVAVALLAFLAVFREGAETILFLHALAVSNGWSMALLAGLVSAAAALILLFFIINIVAQRLPLRALFIATSGFLFVMAIKFVGEAIQELQEQRLVSHTAFAGSQLLSACGLNPTLEALVIQGIVIVLAVISVGLLDRRARRAAMTIPQRAPVA